jgi:two-component system chemotaxis sensor kinase CheA
LFDELLRRAHTLKGAARAVGLGETEELAHGVEDTFIRLRTEGGSPDAAALRAVHGALDRAEDILARAQGQLSAPEPDSESRHASVAPAESSDSAPAFPGPAPSMPQQELVRVDPAILDAMVGDSVGVVMAVAAATSATGVLEQRAAEIDEAMVPLRLTSRHDRPIRSSLRLRSACTIWKPS